MSSLDNSFFDTLEDIVPLELDIIYGIDGHRGIQHSDSTGLNMGVNSIPPDSSQSGEPSRKVNLVKPEYDKKGEPSPISNVESSQTTDMEVERKSTLVHTNSGNTSMGKSQPTPTDEVDDHHQAATHLKLSKTLTQLVKEYAVNLKRVCESQLLSSSMLPSTTMAVNDIVEDNPDGQPKKKKRTSCQLVRDTVVSFELPPNFDKAGIDLNKLKMPVVEGKLNRYSEKMHQFSFNERLQRWNVQCMARSDGKLDLYYYYEKTGKKFRSVKEVVHFMMFEVYPSSTAQKMEQRRKAR